MKVWHKIPLRLQARTRIHLGYRDLGFVSMTRRYIPSRTFTGAVAANLTLFLWPENELNPSKFRQVENFVNKHLTFSYFYISYEREMYRPFLEEKHVHYGNLYKGAFDGHFLSSDVSSAIDYSKQSIRENTLHEMEYIIPRTEDDHVYFEGFLFVKEGDIKELELVVPDNDVIVSRESESASLTEVMNIMQLGGESRYGFGRVKVIDDLTVKDDAEFFEGFEWVQGEDLRFRTSLSSTEFFLPCHLCFNDKIDFNGEVEPFLGRRFSQQHGGFGQITSRAYPCLVPGTKLYVTEQAFFQVGEYGIWEIIR